MAPMMGMVETARVLEYGPRRGSLVHGFIRDTAGKRWFLHQSDCPDGTVPRRFDSVEFEPDERGDPKGPRARRVRIFDAPGGNDPAPSFVDAIITCSECREPFVWSADEQRFYASRRLYAPKKCATCRHVVRARRSE